MQPLYRIYSTVNRQQSTYNVVYFTHDYKINAPKLTLMDQNEFIW